MGIANCVHPFIGGELQTNDFNLLGRRVTKEKKFNQKIKELQYSTISHSSNHCSSEMIRLVVAREQGETLLEIRILSSGVKKCTLPPEKSENQVWP